MYPICKNVFAATAKRPPNGQKSLARGLVVRDTLEQATTKERPRMPALRDVPKVPAHKERPQEPAVGDVPFLSAFGDTPCGFASDLFVC